MPTRESHRRVLTISSLLILAIIAVGLSGCADTAAGASQSVTPKPSASATAAAFTVGATLTKDAALKLRQTNPDNGDYAYVMPDGTWIATNINQPLPAPVVADQQAKANAVPKAQGSTIADSSAGVAAADKYVGLYEYATGRSVAYISLQLQASSSELKNVPTWTILGIPGFAHGWPSLAAAQQGAAAAIAASGNAAQWDVVIQQ